MMKRMFFLAAAAAFLAPAAVSAQAEVTANAGFVSQYYYRGIFQKTASASAGLDVGAGMFSAGTWAADVGDGAEVDLYGGVAIPVGETVSLSLGGTGYFYTGQFDDTYLEANLGLGIGPVSLEWSLGEYGNFDKDNKLKYTYIGLTAEQDGFYLTVATQAANSKMGDAISDAFDKDKGGQYLEAGYGFSAMDMDFVISSIYTDKELSSQPGETATTVPELTFVFGISKTFNLSGM